MFNRNKFELRMLNLIADKYEQKFGEYKYAQFYDLYNRCSQLGGLAPFYGFHDNPFISPSYELSPSYHVKFDRFAAFNTNPFDTFVNLLYKLFVFKADAFNIEGQIYDFSYPQFYPDHKDYAQYGGFGELDRLGIHVYDRTWGGLKFAGLTNSYLEIDLHEDVYLIEDYCTNLNKHASMDWFHNLSNPFIMYDLIWLCSIDELLDIMLAAFVGTFGSNFSLVEKLYGGDPSYVDTMTNLCNTRESCINTVYELKILLKSIANLFEDIHINISYGKKSLSETKIEFVTTVFEPHSDVINSICSESKVLLDKCEYIITMLKSQRCERTSLGFKHWTFSNDYNKVVNHIHSDIVVPFMDLYSGLEQYKQSLTI